MVVEAASSFRFKSGPVAMNPRVVAVCLAVACLVGLCHWLGVFTFVGTGVYSALTVVSDFIKVARVWSAGCSKGLSFWGGVFSSVWTLFDQVLWVVSDWIAAFCRGSRCVFQFFMDIFLTGPMWQKYLASIFLLGVACVIIGAWGLLIYNDYLNKPENRAWMRGCVFGAVVLDTRKDLLDTSKAICGCFKAFIEGIVGAVGLLWFVTVLVCYFVFAAVFGCISAIFLTIGFVYGSCWAVKSNHSFCLRPSHHLRMFRRPVPFAPLNAAPMNADPQPDPSAPPAPPAPPAPAGRPARMVRAQRVLSPADLALAARARAIRQAGAARVVPE